MSKIKETGRRNLASSIALSLNTSGTNAKIDTPLTHPGSRPVRYELVRADGAISPMKFNTAAQAAEAAKLLWPDQEQDDERTGKGWDIQVAGS